MQDRETATVDMRTRIKQQLERERKLLLETGTGNNNLISYKLSTSQNPKGLQITGRTPAELLKALVIEPREMSFKACLPENRGEESTELSLVEDVFVGTNNGEYLFVEDEDSEVLMLNYTSKEARKRLLKTRQEARAEADDKGFNFLHLALGMLEWFNKNEKEPRRAPLVLVPVALEKSNKGEGFVLRYTEEDIQENSPIVVKVKDEFDLELPQMSENTKDLDLDTYFNGIEEAIRERQPTWSVDRNAVFLDLFKFTRLPMYKDLDNSRWPEEHKLVDHDFIKDFLENAVRSGEDMHGKIEDVEEDNDPEDNSGDISGDASPNGEGFTDVPNVSRSAERDGASLDEKLDPTLDEKLDPKEIRPVVEADSSQLAALLEVRNGENLVIQGPPGTGKSQTITNIIADAVGQGKSVLFVAEKMAALDVVHRRLETVGLGDACLVLHSIKSKGIKKSLLDELNRTLGLEETDLPREGSDIRALVRERDQLNAYSRAVNTSIGESEVSPHQAIGELVRLGRQGRRDTSFLDQTEARGWSWQEFLDKRRIVEDLQAVLKNQVLVNGVTKPQEHPFFGSTLNNLPNKSHMENSCSLAMKRTRELVARVGRLALSLGSDAGAHESGGCNPEVLCGVARLVDEAPNLGSLLLDAEEWREHGDEARAYAETGLRLAEVKKGHEDVLIPEAWDEDLREIRQHLATPGGFLGMGKKAEYEAARSRLAGLCRGSVPKKPAEQVALVDVVLEAQRLSNELESNAETGSRLLGGAASEPDGWSSLLQAAEWARGVLGAIEEGWFPEVFFSPALKEARGLKEQVSSVETALDEKRDASSQALEVVGMGEPASRELLERPLSEQEQQFRHWRVSFGDLSVYANFNRLLEDCRKAGLDEVAVQAVEWDEAAEGLVKAFEYEWYESLYGRAYEERDELSRFARATHEETLRRFREADKRVLEHNKAYLKRAHREQVRQAKGRVEYEEQLRALRHEVQKKAGHKPIRRLMLEAGDVVRGAKPVIMMSPQSVANFLDPEDKRRFDLVIFDEASQVEPVDAFGAIARGNQVVVVGDQRQMPPTSFFGSKGGGAEDDSTARDLESILGLLLAGGTEDRMLSWHYRSEHESLIEVSNEQFYNNELTVFPSPYKGSPDAGLRHHRLKQEDAPYEPGGEGSKKAVNPGEARAVAKEVMKHAQRSPELTLAVVAFSASQRDEIEKHVNQLDKSDEAFKEFLSQGGDGGPHEREGFVVKNLENVQGDERDVIFISVGYGRDKNGKLHTGFGPVNQEGGERRLNVLITRARQACHVFTNLSSGDLPNEEGTRLGVKGLQEFLRRAEEREAFLERAKGPQEEKPPATENETTPFEEAVARVLGEHSYAAEKRVGSKKLYVDLAVLDPKDSGRYLLGVQLDGPGYGSARSARDRDIVRQSVLVGKYGWRLHQIWSPDWYTDLKGETKRLLAAVEEARQEARDTYSESDGADDSFEIGTQSNDDTPNEPDNGLVEHETPGEIDVVLETGKSNETEESDDPALPRGDKPDQASTEVVTSSPVPGNAADDKVPDRPIEPDAGTDVPNVNPPKKLKVVPQLLHDKSIALGTELTLRMEALSRAHREILDPILRQDPDMGRVRWTGKSDKQAIKWLKDGQEYSVTGLVLKILRQHGIVKKSIQGTICWTVPDGRTLVEVAESLTTIEDSRSTAETASSSSGPGGSTSRNVGSWSPESVSPEPEGSGIGIINENDTSNGSATTLGEESEAGAEAAKRDTMEPPVSVVPYQLASPSVQRGQDLLAAGPGWLMERVVEVVRKESPVHRQEISRRLAGAAGKPSNKVLEKAVKEACEEAAGAGRIKKRDFVFFWSPEMQEPPLRNRDALPGVSKKLKLVALEEIAAAIEAVVLSAEGGLERKKAKQEALELLGLLETTENAAQRAERAIDEVALGRDQLSEQDGWLSAGESQ